MIFKKLFRKNKWLSNKVSDRLAAITELEPNNNEQKSTLHELAFNDIDKSVRRAALEKLDDFSLFWQAQKKDSHEEVVRFSLNKVKQALLDSSNKVLNEQQKKTFILECTNSKLIDDIKFDLPSVSLLEAALQRLDKQELFIEALLLNKLSVEKSNQVIDSVESEAQLKKLEKKLAGDSLSRVQEKLDHIQQHRSAIIQAEKKAKLVLAQLNALKDQKEFEALENSYASLSQEWQELSPLVEQFDAHLKHDMFSKYDRLTEDLRDRLTLLEVSYLEQKQIQERQLELKNNAAEINKKLNDFELQLNQLIDSDQDIELGMTESLKEIAMKVDKVEFEQSDEHSIYQRLDKLNKFLIELPLVKETKSQAVALLEKLNSVEVPSSLTELNDTNSAYRGLKQEWRDITKSVGFSESLDKQFKELTKELDSKFKALETEQNKLFKSFQRKQAEVSDLIQKGRFREAFGLFGKLSRWHSDLNQSQQAQLAFKWEKTVSEIEALRDLEQNIAAPKRQEILFDIEKIATTPLIDPTEQAHRVKLLRSNWNSLGRLDKDDELNVQFNTWSEKAFAPCRAYYQELEAQRAKSLESKILVIEQMETLATKLSSETVQSWKEIENLYHALQKSWQETGLIDKDKVSETNARYGQAAKQVKVLIAEQYAQNKAAKEQLIEKVQKVVASDQSLSEKSEVLKTLQNEWKEIGNSGVRYENKLWQTFRTINNQVFDELKSQKNDERAASNAIKLAAIESLKALQVKLDKAETPSDVKEIAEQVHSLEIDTQSIGKKELDTVLQAKRSLIAKLEKAESTIKIKAKNRQFADLFNVLAEYPNDLADVNGHFKTSWINAYKQSSAIDREAATIKLEILAERPSPESVSKKRSSIQMEMMTSKLESGVTQSTEELLEEWLSAGALKSEELDLLSRIKPIFVEDTNRLA